MPEQRWTVDDADFKTGDDVRPLSERTVPLPASPARSARSLPSLSQSLQSKMACGHLFAETMRRGRDLPSSPYAQRGIEIHDAIEQYLKHLVASRQPSDYEYFDRLLESGYGEEALGILDGMKEYLIVDPERVLAVEPYLALDEDLNPIEVPDLPSHALQSAPPERAAYAGIPDYLQSPERTTIECWDWKSYFQVIDPESFQSKFYPLLIFQHYPGAERVRFHLQFVRYGISRSVEFTRADDLDKLRTLAKRERSRLRSMYETYGLTQAPDQDKLRQLADEQLQAMPGGHCVYCPLLATGCPIAQVNPYTTQKPEDRLKFAIWAAAALKENNAVLREYVKAGGPVTVADGNGMQYAAEYRLEEKHRIPLRDSLPVLQTWCANNVGDAEMLGKLCVGSTELRPLLKAKKRTALAEQLKAIETTKPGTRWHVGKVGEPSDEEE